MNQPLLPPQAPIDDVLYWQGFYWACISGHLHGGYFTRGAALQRLSQGLTRTDSKDCMHMFWRIGGPCSKCGAPMPADMRAYFIANPIVESVDFEPAKWSDGTVVKD